MKKHSEDSHDAVTERYRLNNFAPPGCHRIFLYFSDNLLCEQIEYFCQIISIIFFLYEIGNLKMAMFPLLLRFYLISFHRILLWSKEQWSNGQNLVLTPGFPWIELMLHARHDLSVYRTRYIENQNSHWVLKNNRSPHCEVLGLAQERIRIKVSRYRVSDMSSFSQ